MKQDDIQYLLGEISGKLDAINQRLDKINGTLDKHDGKINELEKFRDNLQGKMTVISTIGGFIGGLITIVINYFTKKL